MEITISAAKALWLAARRPKDTLRDAGHRQRAFDLFDSSQVYRCP
jgi:hypothetical protein